MNKVNVIKINDRHNVIQRYKFENKDGGIIATVLGYDLATSDGKFIQSFADFDEAKHKAELQ